jgi:Aminopeptidase I zinc metalloprotease (M18)
MTGSRLGMRANDAGIPQLSMHGIRATTGSLDPGLGVKPYKGFFDYYEDFDAEFRQFSIYIKLLVSFDCIVGSVESPAPPRHVFLIAHVLDQDHRPSLGRSFSQTWYKLFHSLRTHSVSVLLISKLSYKSLQ